MGVGIAIDTAINGGRLTLDSSSTASGTTVGSNGRLTVFGGTTSDTTIKNGWLEYLSNDCNNNPGAYGSAVASNTVVESGSEQIVGFLRAATTINTFVEAGTQYIGSERNLRIGLCQLAKMVSCHGQSRLRPRQAGAGAALGCCSSCMLFCSCDSGAAPKGYSPRFR
ncbi:hypothetical protein [Bradyrhizobium erythrophlei]|uniref:hypothetical protein n=1 Tax=Bradyrhizobium erythrophlei TaxID=1437360 RepID=UPI0015C5412A|nr:hypothetical protein [Bradyrhizobium erythrophlei]